MEDDEERGPGADSGPAGTWARGFFEGPFFPVQRAQGPAPDEVAYIERALEIGDGPRDVLDVPCGTGRHAVVLGSHGHRVHGIDFNPGAIEHGEAWVASQGLSGHVRLDVGDMRRLDVPKSAYDAALCFWGSFGYGDDGDDRRFLAGVRAALRPGGRFLLDLHVAETLLPIFEPRGWHWWGDGEDRVRVIEERRWDPFAGRVETEWRFQRRDGSETVGRSSIRIYTARELVEMLLGAGFAVPRLEESVTGAPFDVGADRLGLVARAAP